VIGKHARLLVLAPHVDDEINCAGLIARVTAAGGKALILACSPAFLSVPKEMAGKNILDEFRQSCGILRAEHMLLDVPVRGFYDYRTALREKFFDLKRSADFSHVLAPAKSDVHQDHTVVHEEAFRVFRNAAWFLCWESPNNQREAVTDIFVTLTPAHMADKKAAWACYETQHHRAHYGWAYWESMASLRGHQCRCQSKLAEAYEHMVAVI